MCPELRPEDEPLSETIKKERKSEVCDDVYTVLQHPPGKGSGKSNDISQNTQTKPVYVDLLRETRVWMYVQRKNIKQGMCFTENNRSLLSIRF